jgi:hypothetical protein
MAVFEQTRRSSNLERSSSSLDAQIQLGAPTALLARSHLNKGPAATARRWLATASRTAAKADGTVPLLGFAEATGHLDQPSGA